MDFFMQDDDDCEQAPSASQSVFSQGNSQTAWQCIECGGDDWYMDTATNLQHCSSCFSQSQSQSQSQVGMEYDEVVMMAAKRQSGALVQARPRSRKSMAPRVSKKLPLEPLNQARPLPTLKECLDGLDSIWNAWIRVLVRDILKGTQQQEVELGKSVQLLWKGYLRAWGQGAEHYGALWPGRRFSLRDCFLASSHLDMISRHLSFQVAKKKNAADKVKADASSSASGDDDDDDDDNESSDSDSSTSRALLASSDDDDDHDEDSSDDEPDVSKAQRRKKKPKQKMDVGGERIDALQRLHSRKRKGPMEAALSRPPNLTFCASLLWLAAYQQLQVSSRQFAIYIANGTLPVLSSFRLLTTEQQETLRPIQSYFRLQTPPGPAVLEYRARLVAVACGLKSVAAWNGAPVFIGRTKEVVGAQLKYRELAKQNDLKAETIRFVTPADLPVVTAELVADAGLPQAALDWTLTIMGCCRPKPSHLSVMSLLLTQQAKRNRLKQDSSTCAGLSKTIGVTRAERMQAVTLGISLPWRKATLDKISSVTHICAVLFYACQLCPDWRTWTYHQTSASTNRSGSNKLCDRVVPWNSQQFGLMGNGSLKGYLDFYDSVVQNPQESLAPDFMNLLPMEDSPTTAPTRKRTRQEEEADGETGTSSSKHPVVRPCTQLLGPKQGKNAKAQKPRFSPALGDEPEQHLLLEYLAYTGRVGKERIVDAYLDIFSTLKHAQSQE